MFLPMVMSLKWRECCWEARVIWVCMVCTTCWTEPLITRPFVLRSPPDWKWSIAKGRLRLTPSSFQAFLQQKFIFLWFFGHLKCKADFTEQNKKTKKRRAFANPTKKMLVFSEQDWKRACDLMCWVVSQKYISWTQCLCVYVVHLLHLQPCDAFQSCTYKWTE